MAVGWHPDTVAGAIGRLAQEAMPAYDEVTYNVFVLAASAIVKAGLLGEVQSPLAKEAIAFVEASKGKPQVFAPTCEAALQARIGTFIQRPWVHPSTLEDEADIDDLYKRVKMCSRTPGHSPNGIRSGRTRWR